LFNSTLKFDSDKRVLLDKDLITENTEKYNSESKLKIENKKLDYCYFLKSNVVEFNTPKYKLAVHSSSDTGFLQVYTPPIENVIAIEPTTGISNSFNNKIGLQTLSPKEEYDISWKLVITNLQ